MEFALALLQHVPRWVWIILAYIVYSGLKQSQEQRMTRQRLIVLPAVWLAYGAWGVASTFGLLGLPALAWAAGIAAGFALLLRSDFASGARYDVQDQRYVAPGSWLPLGLMIAIFCAKFALGMTLAMQPGLAHELAFRLGSALVFGTISGALLGRSVKILRGAAAKPPVAFA
jgi:hypothetical protein